MKFWTIIRIISGVLFIIIGILLVIFLRMLNDPEIEGETGRISLGSYIIPTILVIIGVVLLFIKKNFKNSN